MTSAKSRFDAPLAALAFAVFVLAFQNFMVIPALPAIGRDFGTTAGWTTWVFTGFVLTSAIASPLLGKLGDRIGRRRVTVGALACFFLGAVGAVVAPNIGVLVACRMLQGVGNVVLPLGYSILKERYPPERLGHAAGVLTSGLTLGTGSGLLTGGIVDALSWRVLFGFSALLVGIALVLVHRFIPETSAGARVRPDIAGGALLTAALATLLLAITQGASWGWTSPRVAGMFAASLVLSVTWALVELRIDEPMVDVRLLSRRPILMTNLAASIGTGFAVSGALVVIPRLLAAPRGLPPAASSLVHYGFGASTAVVGLYMLPWAVGGLPAAFVSNRFAGRFGLRASFSLGLVLVGAGLALLAVWHATWWQVLIALPLVGFGFPVAAVASSTLLVSAVSRAEAGVAMGVNTVIRQIGSATAAQVVAAILTTQTIGSTGVATETAYEIALGVLAIASFIGLGINVLSSPGRGSGVARAPTAEAAEATAL